jgi:hypothetical protein
MNSFRIWLENATAEEVDKLAKLAKTSPAYLRHIALERRQPSAHVAGQIEKSTAQMGRTGLPIVLRGDVNKTCNSCPYYKQCKKK